MLKKGIKTFFIILLFIVLLGSATTVWAECLCYCNGGNKVVSSSDCGSNCDPCGGQCSAGGFSYNPQNACKTQTPDDGVYDDYQAKDGITIKNPLSASGNPVPPEELYARLISGLLAFVGVASLIAFVFSGFTFLTSAGNPEKVKKAKDVMIYAVIGIIISMASYAILSFIFKTLETATNNPSGPI